MAAGNRQRRSSPPATASLPYFPPELIPEVARRLTSLQDFFALRAACRTYRALLTSTSSNLASQAPLLLVPLEYTLSHALFHPNLRRIHGFRFHRTLLADDDYASTDFHSLGGRLAIYVVRGRVGTLSIVNLLTGERTCLSTPPERIHRVLPYGDLVLPYGDLVLPYGDRVLPYGDLVLTWKCSGCAVQYCHLEAADWRVA